MTVTASTPQRESVRNGVPAYLALAFGVAWVSFLPVVWGGPALPPVLMPFAPAIACVVVRRWVTREGFGDAGLRPVTGRRGVWIAALAWPLLVLPVAVVLAQAVGAGPSELRWPWGAAAPGLGAVVVWLGMSVAAIPVLLGEEIGWRGYLQVRILPGRPLLAALVTGVVWGVWHYPLLLTTAGPGTHLAVLLPLFTVATVTMSVFLGWLRSAGGSVWVSGLGHSSNNVTEDNLNHTSLATTAGGALSDGAAVVVVLAEALVLLGIVFGDRLRQRTRHRPLR
jgi:CAAX protease family protein